MIRYTDIYPAGVTPRPSGIPQGSKIRAIITDEFLTFGWLYGTAVQRLDIPLEPGDVPDDVTYNGGTVAGYTISRTGACSSCGGGAKLTGWRPWPDVPMTEDPRKEVAQAQRTANGRPMTGIVPVRYSRSR